MRQASHVFGMLAVGLVVAFGQLGSVAVAQEGAPESTQTAPDGIKQIKLTEAQVKGFIAAQPDMEKMFPKLQAAGDKPTPKLEAELDGIAKKHGFADFSELDNVAANISIVMAGLDSQTGEFIEPAEALKKELKDVETDSSIPEATKKQLVQELSEAIKTTPVLEHRENVELVRAHRAEIEKALQ